MMTKEQTHAILKRPTLLQMLASAAAWLPMLSSISAMMNIAPMDRTISNNRSVYAPLRTLIRAVQFN